MAFAGAQAPPGWLPCDGKPVSRTQYAALFAAIGAASGPGDGATTFNVPDYRGRFLRGVDEGAGNDPDAARRTPASTGANGGDAVGSLEGSAFASHQHAIVDPGHGHGVSDPGHGHGVSDPGHSHGVNDPGHGHQACFGEETETTVEPIGSFGRTADWWENWDGCTNNVVQRNTTGIGIGASVTGISLQNAQTGISVQSSPTGISDSPAGGSSETRPVNVAVYWIIKT
jgi:phage-related tail fiber protein